eukprot:2798207-Alexandrium_andersonii.AAC.1
MEQARGAIHRARDAHDQAWRTYMERGTRGAPRALLIGAWSRPQQAKDQFHLLRYTYTALAGLGHLWLRWLTWWPGGRYLAQRWGPDGGQGGIH